MTVTEKRVSYLEETMQKLAYEHLNTEIMIQNNAREMMDFKDEMKVSRKELNKRWGELANKMGTIVEDIVAPILREGI